MNMERILRGARAAGLVVCSSLIALGALPALGQQQERGLVRVGAPRKESKGAQNVELWALLIGVSRFQNGD